MAATALAGIDIGGTKTAVVLSADPPKILERVSFPTNPHRGPESVLTQIMESLRTMLCAHGLTSADLRSIGVSCGSPLDPIHGIIQAPPNLPTWEHVPITSILETEFNVRSRLENDANAGALAEHSFGAGRQYQSMIFLTFGTGLGAGLILDGRLYRGASFAAGEIGHVRLTRLGPTGYSKVGSAEGWASGGGMVQVAAGCIRSARKRAVTTLLDEDLQNAHDGLTAKKIWEAAQQQDPVALEIIRKCGTKLGEAIAILIDLFNPDCIVVGGLAMRMGETILGPARQMAMQESLPASFRDCKIVVTSLGESIGDVASICVAMQRGD